MENASFKLQFKGKATEYFGIWIANLALSIITLGIYSPWAKVRRLRYFYQNTTLIGSSFDFHGEPGKILIGRIIAIIFFAIYSTLSNLQSYYQLAAFGMLIVFAPFMIQRALRFRLRYTSYRGLRFNFTGSIKRAFIDCLLIPFISVLPLGLGYPFGLRQWRRYQLRNSAYGKTNFHFDASIIPFYVMAFFSIGPFFLVGFIAAISIAVVTFIGKTAKQAAETPNLDIPEQYKGAVIAVALLFAVFLLLVRGIHNYLKHRIIFNNLTIGDYQFKSLIRFWPCVGVFAVNDILSAITLGLFRPFAQIRAAKIQIENIEITGPADIGHFVGESTPPASALGAEAVDFFDFDLGF
jgi:uncharacterized membrane protein YjgN (DUF898 family)